MKILKAEEDEVIIEHAALRVIIYEHPDGYLAIFAERASDLEPVIVKQMAEENAPCFAVIGRN